MSKGTLRITAVFIFLLLPPAGFAATLHVPGDFPTIQDAINAAEGGDIILVAPGTYLECISFLGKAIAVRSTEGPAATVIDANGSGSVVSFQSGEGPGSILRGFTLTNGRGEGGNGKTYGGGVFCRGASPTIEKNLIQRNRASSGGGICVSEYASPRIIDNIFAWNEGDDHSTLGSGGGIYCRKGSCPAIINNLFRENRARIRGGAVLCSNSDPALLNNTITGNEAPEGGGICCRSNSHMIVSNTILWSNTALAGKEIYLEDSAFPSTLDIRHSCVEGGQASAFVDPGCTLMWGEGMIDQDPLFTAGPLGDYYLSHTKAGQAENSPCRDAGDAPSFSVHIDALTTMDIRTTRTDHLTDHYTVDMGYHYPSEIGARFGNVNLLFGWRSDVLFVNGNLGDANRVLTVTLETPIAITMKAPPAGPNAARFCLYGVHYEPKPAHMADQPYRIGTSCIPMPMRERNSVPPPSIVANNIGFYGALGWPLLPWIGPAPRTVLKLPFGLPRGSFAFQGIIFDNGSAGRGISLTNAVVVKVQK